eukprot:6183971-Pleurochrysis_carterae.AAC.5
MFGFTKAPDPKEQLKKWKADMRAESRKIDRQILSTPILSFNYAVHQTSRLRHFWRRLHNPNPPSSRGHLAVFVLTARCSSYLPIQCSALRAFPNGMCIAVQSTLSRAGNPGLRRAGELSWRRDPAGRAEGEVVHQASR